MYPPNNPQQENWRRFIPYIVAVLTLIPLGWSFGAIDAYGVDEALGVIIIGWAVGGAVLTMLVYVMKRRNILLGAVLGLVLGGLGGLLMLIPLWFLTPELRKTCPRCAEKIKLNADICRHCGFQFPLPANPAYRGGFETYNRGQFSRPATHKTCPQCAEDVKAAAKICRYCGYQFSATAELNRAEDMRPYVQGDPATYQATPPIQEVYSKPSPTYSYEADPEFYKHRSPRPRGSVDIRWYYGAFCLLVWAGLGAVISLMDFIHIWDFNVSGWNTIVILPFLSFIIVLLLPVKNINQVILITALLLPAYCVSTIGMNLSEGMINLISLFFPLGGLILFVTIAGFKALGNSSQS